MALYGLIAEFDSPEAVLKASKEVVKKGYKNFDTYSPFPIHGIEKAMNLPASKLPWIVLIMGTFGLVFGFGMQTWVATSAYKLTLSGKPLFSYQAFVPVGFELTILFSAFGAVFGMFAINQLPKFYHPVFNKASFKKVTSHGFFMSIEADDQAFNLEKTKRFLEEIGGMDVSELKQ